MVASVEKEKGVDVLLVSSKGRRERARGGDWGRGAVEERLPELQLALDASKWPCAYGGR